MGCQGKDTAELHTKEENQTRNWKKEFEKPRACDGNLFKMFIHMYCKFQNFDIEKEKTWNHLAN